MQTVFRHVDLDLFGASALVLVRIAVPVLRVPGRFFFQIYFFRFAFAHGLRLFLVRLAALVFIWFWSNCSRSRSLYRAVPTLLIRFAADLAGSSDLREPLLVFFRQSGNLKSNPIPKF